MNNNKPYFTNTSSGTPDYSDSKRVSPYQLRREFMDCLDAKTRLAIILHCLCGYPASAAYAIAFNFKGSHKSLAPSASRFFNSPGIRSMCKLFVRYFLGVPYHTADKYYND